MSSASNDESTPGASGALTLSSLRTRIQTAQTELTTLLQTFDGDKDVTKLLGLVHSSTTELLRRFDGTTPISAITLAHIHLYTKTLESAHQSAVERQPKSGIPKMIGMKRKQTTDDLLICCNLLEASFSACTSQVPSIVPSNSTGLTSQEPPHQRNPTITHAPAIPDLGDDEDQRPAKKKKTRGGEYTLEVAETVFTLAAQAADFAPAPFAAMVKVIAETGKTIVQALKDVQSNREAVNRLRKLVTEYTQRIATFLQEVGDPADPVLQNITLLSSLEAFQKKVQNIAERALEVTDQRLWKQIFKHTINKQDLEAFSTELEDAFKILKLQLHLNVNKSIRWLERKSLLDVLGGGDNGATSKAVRPEDLLCHQGTRENVLQELGSWISSSNSGNVIWITGVAGSGKTAIAATIAHHQILAEACVAIFHFNRSTPARNGSVIRSLAKMLVTSETRLLAASILNGVRKLQDSSSDYISTQFDHLMTTPVATLPQDSTPIICILDALDEWDEPGNAAELMRVICTARLPPCVKFVITSRRDRHLEQAYARLESHRPQRYHLDTVPRGDVTQDIRILLESTLSRIKYEARGSSGSWPDSKALDQLAELAQGLFQWAATICRYIEGGDIEENLAAVLNLSSDPARELDDVYGLVIHRFASTSGSNVRLLNDVLGCLIVAPTPMSLNTLANILNVTSEPKSDSRSRCDGQIFLKDAVLSHLRALLVIPDDIEEPIRFLHSSIIDFLTDSDRLSDAITAADARGRNICRTKGITAVDCEDHNARVAKLCFDAMDRDLRIHVPEKIQCHDIEEARHRAIEFTPPALRYVARYWPEYVLHLKPNSARIVQYGLGTLLENFARRSILAWIEAMACMGEMGAAASSVFLVESWLAEVTQGGGPAQASLTSQATHTTGLLEVVYLLRETQQLIAAFHEGLSTFSFNFHHTLRTWLPVDTRLHSLYSESLPALLKVIRGSEVRNWTPCLWSVAHGSPVGSIALSKDGGYMISGGICGPIGLWSTAMRKKVPAPVNLEMEQVEGVAFGVGGSIVAATYNAVVIWRMETRTEEVLRGSEGIAWNCVATSSDGCQIVAGGSEDLCLWEDGGRRPPRKLEGHTHLVHSVAFSPDDTLIASGSEDNIIRLWDVSTATQRGKPLRGHGYNVKSLAFSPDGKTLVSASSDTIRLWIAETGECKWTNIGAHSEGLCSVAFSRDGNTIASGSSYGTVRLWDAETGQSKGEPFSGHLGSVTSVVFTLNDRSVISGGSDGTIRMWDISGTSHPVAQPLGGHSNDVIVIAFSPDGKFIVTGSRDHTLRLWDTETGEAVGNRVEHGTRVTCVAFSRDGQCMISGDDHGTLRIWDPLTLIARGGPIDAHPNRVINISFSPDSTTFVSTSDDGTICRWDADTCRRIGEPLSDQPGYVMSADFATSGRHFLSFRFATGVFLPGQQTIYLHDAASGARLGNPIVPRGHQLTYRAIFSSDDTAVISDMGYAWDVQGILDGMCSDAAVIPGFEVVFETMRSDTTVPLWIDERGWINLAGKSFLWLPPDYGRNARCWWRRGIIAIADRRVLILDARNVPLSRS